MTAEPIYRGPWGIVVTSTLHFARKLGPACGNSAVQATVEKLRLRYKAGERDAPPIYGYADHRPVCRDCIRTLRRIAAADIADANEAETWNEVR